MRAVIQRVLEGEVVVNGSVVGNIGKGIVVLVAFSSADDDKTIDYMLNKIIGLRIFEDENDKMNVSLADISGELLIVPNFTIYGDVRKGKRSSFVNSALPDVACEIFTRFVNQAENMLPGRIVSGVFRADMKVKIINDGPVTVLIDSDKCF
ncbi:MAG: D-aminoacyl-tRNA deacylase [Defluviitaleaceae bacterium]|nr:D-aminoacyl-tRNA deacylase [Defluviitaleaceae bacterium]